MSLKGIISISGVPGLYKVLAQTKSGFIVESLSDKKRMPVASTQRISMLNDISVFTNTDDLPLRDVLLKLKDYAETKPVVDPKEDPTKLREFFKKIVPEYDAERVYPSDIKKIINWFHLVKDFVAIEDEPEEETDESTGDSREEETEQDHVTRAKPAKQLKSEKEEKPVKKAPATKEEKTTTPKKKKTATAKEDPKEIKTPKKTAKKTAKKTSSKK